MLPAPSAMFDSVGTGCVTVVMAVELEPPKLALGVYDLVEVELSTAIVVEFDLTVVELILVVVGGTVVLLGEELVVVVVTGGGTCDTSFPTS